jgi:hypothetical protein
MNYEKKFFVENIEDIGVSLKVIRERVFKNPELRELVEDWLSTFRIRTPLCELLKGIYD